MRDPTREPSLDTPTPVQEMGTDISHCGLFLSSLFAYFGFGPQPFVLRGTPGCIQGHSCKSSGYHMYHMRCQGLSMGLPYARQTLFLLYSHPGLFPFYFFWLDFESCSVILRQYSGTILGLTLTADSIQVTFVVPGIKPEFLHVKHVFQPDELPSPALSPLTLVYDSPSLTHQILCALSASQYCLLDRDLCARHSPMTQPFSSLFVSNSQVSRSACLMTTQLICKLLRSREAAAAVDIRAWPPILDTGKSQQQLGNWLSALLQPVC